MSARRALAALVVAAVLGGLGSAAVAAPASAATDPVSVVVAPRGGGIVPAGQDLDLEVTLTNTGGTRLSAGRLAFSLQAGPVASTTALTEELASPERVLLGQLSRTGASTPALDPGETRTVEARISADDLDSILSSASGARLLYARYRDGSGTVQQVAESAVVRMAKGFSGRIGLGTVVPVLAPANTTGLVDTAAQASLTADGGAWATALDAARQDPSATVALDPEVLASIRLAGDAAPEGATRFLGELRALPNQFVRLAYGDGDVTLQRAAGASGTPLEPTSFAGSSTAARPSAGSSASPTPAPTTGGAAVPDVAEATSWNWSKQRVLWPVPGTTAAGDVAAAAHDDAALLLATSDLQDSAARMLGGPVARIAARGGSAEVLVADADASRLLAAASRSGTAGRAAMAELSGLLATAAATGETPAVLAVPGRSADAAGVGRALSLLAKQPWVAGRSLAELSDAAAAPATVRLGRTGTPSSRLATARALVAGERSVRTLGGSIDSSAGLVGPERLALLGALSAAWRSEDDGAWRTAAAGVEQEFQDFTGRVHLTEQSASTAIGVDGTLRTAVVNGLSRPVTVLVRAQVSNGRLQFTDARDVRLTVPANASRSAQLSFRTITNGPTDITLSLATPDGHAFGASVDQKVTVRAGFDTIVAVALLGALGVLLALGVYRNVTRRRRPRAALA